MSPRKLDSTEELETLIREVRKRELIWYPKLKTHLNRTKCSEAWTEIAGLLNVTVMVAKAKWKNMRDTFLRELKRHKHEPPQTYTGSWRFYEDMWFIHSYFNKRTRSSEEVEDGSEGDQELEPYVLKCEPLMDGDGDHQEDIKATNTIFLESVNEDDDFDGVLSKRSKRDDDDDDYDLMYLKSLLPFLKSLDPMRKLVVRTKIQEILLSEINAQQGKKM